VRAVDGVSFAVPQGKTLGIVGESGCGKSTLVKALIGLESTHGGKAQFKSFDLTQDLAKRDMSLIRDVQMVFQNPDSILNPSHSVGFALERTIRRLEGRTKSGASKEVKRMLKVIVSSATYQQSSTVSPHLLARDPNNRLLTRGPRLRLSAETIEVPAGQGWEG